jgi:hypothetical protein
MGLKSKNAQEFDDLSAKICNVSGPEAFRRESFSNKSKKDNQTVKRYLDNRKEILKKINELAGKLKATIIWLATVVYSTVEELKKTIHKGNPSNCYSLNTEEEDKKKHK